MCACVHVCVIHTVWVDNSVTYSKGESGVILLQFILQHRFTNI